MCGRTVQKTPLGEIRVLFETVNPIPNASPNYNTAPTDPLPVIRLDRDRRRSLDLLRWGLIPYWAKDAKIGARCINAMAETVATKPAFRDAFKRGSVASFRSMAFTNGRSGRAESSPMPSSAPTG